MVFGPLLVASVRMAVLAVRGARDAIESVLDAEISRRSVPVPALRSPTFRFPVRGTGLGRRKMTLGRTRSGGPASLGLMGSPGRMRPLGWTRPLAGMPALGPVPLLMGRAAVTGGLVLLDP